MKLNEVLLYELFSGDDVRIKGEIQGMIQSAMHDKDWDSVEQFADVFETTPYFDEKQNKGYIKFSTDRDTLTKELAKGSFADGYFLKRLYRKMRGSS